MGSMAARENQGLGATVDISIILHESTTNSPAANWLSNENKLNFHVHSNANRSRLHQIKSNNIASYKLIK